jgi:zona occludens toxin (predicted ATPase)
MSIKTTSLSTSAWREPMVWLVVSGPVAAVLAGIVTAAIAFGGADPVVTPASETSRTQATATQRNAATQPAQWARNHSATLAQER